MASAANDRSFMTGLFDRVTALIHSGAVTTSELPLLLKIVLCHYAGRRDFKSIKWVLGALLYVATPIDIIPDAVPLMGFADDAYVISWVMNELASEIADFKRWQETQPVPLEDNKVLLQESLERMKENVSSLAQEANNTMARLFGIGVYGQSLGSRTSGNNSDNRQSDNNSHSICPYCSIS